MHALEPIIDELFTTARRDGRRDDRDAYAFDALVTLAERNHAPGPTADTKTKRPNPSYLGLLRIDLEALLRGDVHDGERCEITGLGPIPARTVEGCPRTRVEIDHRTPYRETRHTRLDDCDPLCAYHHAQKHRHGWALVEGTGKRPFVPPHDPRHPKSRPKRE